MQFSNFFHILLLVVLSATICSAQHHMVMNEAKDGKDQVRVTRVPFSSTHRTRPPFSIHHATSAPNVRNQQKDGLTNKHTRKPHTRNPHARLRERTRKPK